MKWQKSKNNLAFCTAVGFLYTVMTGCNAGQILGFRSTTASVNDLATQNNACKRGLAYNAASANDFAALGPAISWYYTWSVNPVPTALAGNANVTGQFVPMVWGADALTGTSAQTLPQAQALLGFNEPNFGAQSNLTATAAAALWPQVEALAAAQNMTIVSPAVNYCSGDCTASSPFDWLDQFFAACPNCRVDAIGVHAYVCTPTDLQAYLQQFEMRYQRPLWLTEFSCMDTNSPTAAQELAYMQRVVPLLEADPLVQRYAWFTGRDPNASAVDLLAADGSLTPLGQAYGSLPQACQP